MQNGQVPLAAAAAQAAEALQEEGDCKWEKMHVTMGFMIAAVPIQC